MPINVKIYHTVEILKVDAPREKQKYPSYRGVHLIEVFQIFYVIVLYNCLLPEYLRYSRHYREGRTRRAG